MQIPEWEAFTQLLQLNDLYLSDLFAGSYFIAVILPDCYNIHAIYYNIHDRCHDESSQHIKHRMLLDEHGGQDNGNT